MGRRKVSADERSIIERNEIRAEAQPERKTSAPEPGGKKRKDQSTSKDLE